MRAGLFALLGIASLCVGAIGAFANPVGKTSGAGQFLGLYAFPAPVTSTEGIAVDKTGNVFVSVATTATAQIWKLSPSGAASVYADLGPPAGGNGGLAVDANGNVYMVRNLVSGSGVFRVDKKGVITLVPGTDAIPFPNALAFDNRGNLYLTETSSGVPPALGGPGGIWRVPRGGAAELWIQHPLLTGLGPTIYPFPIGANGIAFRQNDLYVINTDMAAVIRVPVRPDGSPGLPEVWAQLKDECGSILDKSPYFPLMLDGIALDVHGNAYLTVISRTAVARIDAKSKEQSTVAVFPNMLTWPDNQVPLDLAVNCAFGTGKGDRQTLYVSNMGSAAAYVPGLPWPGPSVTMIDVGVPGQPLP